MNLHVKDSYKTTNIDEIEKQVIFYYTHSRLDLRRSVNSYIEEWFAHNWMYEHGIFKSHTKDVDLDGAESKLRLLGYKIIFKLFCKK